MNNAIRVLIVDDEERFRETTATILTKRGFAVQAVGSGIEAIDEIKKDDFDVVVLDVQMPGMDGNEALREITKIKPQLPVLMLTGQGTPASAREGLRDGLFDYLTKPCAIDLLAQKIREGFSSEAATPRRELEAALRRIALPRSHRVIRNLASMWQLDPIRS